MSDLISRQAAIDAIENTDWYRQDANNEMVLGANPDMHQAWYKAEDVYKALESVPSAQPEQRWIPCSERLPEDPDTKRIYASKTYQVTTVDGRTIVLLWRKTESRGKMVMRWEWHDGRIYHGDVLAWKPLSEPYKKEGEKNENT